MIGRIKQIVLKLFDGTNGISCIALILILLHSTAGEEKKNRVRIYVLDHGYHTSIVIPAATQYHNWKKRFPHLEDAEYLDFAWGDRDYYQSEGYPVGKGIKALFLPTRSVIHVVALYHRPGVYYPEAGIKSLWVEKEHFLKLLDYIDESFVKKGKKVCYLKQGLYGISAFYRAKNIYHLLYNCNNWVAGGLDAANIRTPLWGGFPRMIMWYANDKEE